MLLFHGFHCCVTLIWEAQVLVEYVLRSLISTGVLEPFVFFLDGKIEETDIEEFTKDIADMFDKDGQSNITVTISYFQGDKGYVALHLFYFYTTTRNNVGLASSRLQLQHNTCDFAYIISRSTRA